MTVCNSTQELYMCSWMTRAVIHWPHPHFSMHLTRTTPTISTRSYRALDPLQQSLDDEKCSFKLPMLIECAKLPNNREEIPSPRVAKGYYHLENISDKIPDLLENVEIELPYSAGSKKGIAWNAVRPKTSPWVGDYWSCLS